MPIETALGSGCVFKCMIVYIVCALMFVVHLDATHDERPQNLLCNFLPLGMLNYDHHPHHRCFAYLNTHQTIYEAVVDNTKMTRFLIRKTMPILYASIV